ncbi:hypothetical protein [Amylibacter sp. IMCC11727]|uniref:hypothetical protein n=1 Tax=Amylibacter sp. IMCC11727 TaxID=3039851 RepID=UPI00244E231A|nr:hypothetical protein [Amylibacter sp. IMCC11727]WGI20633.1 hypothetical protein QBD29_10955 [Amylibacter sp. IMCC11727]
MMKPLSFVCAVMMALPNVTAADDTSVGYYYPEITSQESFDRVLGLEFTASAELRSRFITTLTKSRFESPANPNYVVFAKGSNAQKLIIVALEDEVFDTIYRARAVLAQLTANLRAGLFKDDEKLRVAGTFYDLLQIMEFETLVITDGKTWSHKVYFERP